MKTLFEQVYEQNEQTISLLEQLRDTLVDMNREYKRLENK